jgi:hypothetical protein
MKTKSAILAVIVTAVIIGAFMVVGGANYINNLGGSNPAGSTVFTPTPANPNVPYEGSIAMSVKGSNIGNGTNLTADTNYDVEYFVKAGEVYSKISAETDGTENFVIGKNDIVYAQVTPPASQVFFLDWQESLNANPSGLVKKPAYLDITKDGVIDYVFPLDVTATKQQGAGNPNLTPAFEWYLKFHGDHVFTIDSPSSVTSVGTGTQDSTVTWKLTLDTQPGAEAIKAFQITVNGTRSTNEVAEEQSFINFPFGSEYKKIFLSDPGFQVSEDFSVTAFNATGSNEDAINGKTIMRYTISSQIDGADLIVVGSQGSKVVDVDLTLYTTMDATDDGVCAELRIEPISARNVAGTALVDDVEFAEGATNTYNCIV